MQSNDEQSRASRRNRGHRKNRERDERIRNGLLCEAQLTSQSFAWGSCRIDSDGNVSNSGLKPRLFIGGEWQEPASHIQGTHRFGQSGHGFSTHSSGKPWNEMGIIYTPTSSFAQAIYLPPEERQIIERSLPPDPTPNEQGTILLSTRDGQLNCTVQMLSRRNESAPANSIDPRTATTPKYIPPHQRHKHAR